MDLGLVHDQHNQVPATAARNRRRQSSPSGCRGLSDADYQVLVGLSEAPGHRVRFIELAQLMLWSKSRLGHQLDRMQRRGLVCREGDPASSRAAVVVLTDHGLRTIEQAAPAHVESVRRHFLDLLDDAQIDAIAAATETVVAHLRQAAATSTPPGPDADRARRRVVP